MAAIKSLPHFHLMLLLFQSLGLCVHSPSIIPFPGYPLCHGILVQVWYLIVSIPDLCTLSYFDYQLLYLCCVEALKVSPHFYLTLLLFQSSGLCVHSPFIIPFPGYPLSLVQHLRSLDDQFSYPVVLLLLPFYMWTCISHLEY